MNPKFIDNKSINILGNMYLWSSFWTKEPLKLTGRKAKTIKDRILANRIEELHSLPKEITDFFIISSPEEFLLFLYNCNKERDERDSLRKSAFFKNFSDLDFNTAACLYNFLEFAEPFEVLPKITVDGTTASLVVDDFAPMRRDLFLYDFKCPEEINLDEDFCYPVELIRKEKGFSLKCLVERFEPDTDNESKEEFELEFSKAESKLQLFDYSEGWNGFSSPFELLGDAYGGLVAKYYIHENYLNPKEKELLPLAKELTSLFNNFEIAPEVKTFPLLKNLLLKYGLNEQIKAVIKGENALKGGFANEPIGTGIKIIFAKIATEELWRELYENLKSAVAEYPKNSEVAEAQDELQKIRQRIEARFKVENYEGSYPDFYKTADIMAPKMAYIHGTSAIIFGEKDAKIHIHCREDVNCMGISVDFICGMDITKNKATTDIYSFMFSDKNHRIFSTTSYYHSLDEESRELSDDLDFILDIVLKRAVLKRISLKEKREVHGSLFAFGPFLSTTILMGGFFGIGFTLVSFLVLLGFTVFGGLFESVTEMVNVMPFGFVFWFTSLGFGIPMGIIEQISRRK